MPRFGLGAAFEHVPVAVRGQSAAKRIGARAEDEPGRARANVRNLRPRDARVEDLVFRNHRVLRAGTECASLGPLVRGEIDHDVLDLRAIHWRETRGAFHSGCPPTTFASRPTASMRDEV